MVLIDDLFVFSCFVEVPLLEEGGHDEIGHDGCYAEQADAGAKRDEKRHNRELGRGAADIDDKANPW